MKDYSKIHSFVICAYKESEFLEECILSLKNQSVISNIIMITSTPNLYIEGLAEKYKIKLYVNEGEAGIVQDWNFGYQLCKTPYITIAHQDDIYFETYAENAIKMLKKSKNPLIYFCDYCEIRDGKKVKDNQLLRVKRLLLSPLKISRFHTSRFVRRRILSLGSAICCPSVTFAQDHLPNPVFEVRFRSCEDWQAWERLSKLRGSFVYDPNILMGHRIHEESETSKIINDNARTKEDYEMFCKFWPKVIAKRLVKYYAKSQNSNGE